MSYNKTFYAIVMLDLLLVGCTVGPDFEHPELAPEAGYLADEPSQKSVIAAADELLVYGEDVPARWWSLFENPQLDRLMQLTVENNPDLASARAALRRSSQLALAEGGSLFPSITASVENQQSETAFSTGVYNLSSFSAVISYELDLFGENRRSVEAMRAEAESQAFEAEATYLTLTADLATAVIEEASLREQISATEEIISAMQAQLEILALQVEVGVSSAENLLQQRAELSQRQATLPGLNKQWEQQRNTIAVLAGKFPSQYQDKPFALDDLTLPHELPVSLPSELVQQRPDIRAAEALLHEASANIGVATAEMLPKITLTASEDSSVADIASLFSPSNLIWNVASGLTQTVFQGGTLKHNRDAAIAAYDQAAANYRSVVLGAFKDVANVLQAIEKDSEAYAAYVEAENQAQASLSLAQLQFRVGTGAYVDVLNAQQTHEEARISRASAEADRYLNAVNLFEALGGGWWNRSDTVIPENAAP